MTKYFVLVLFQSRYLQNNHSLYCRPDDAGPGGLSALPIKERYFNGSRVVNGTERNITLPLCNGCKLNGSEAYHAIVGYFTTTDKHPKDIQKLGHQQVDILYPQVGTRENFDFSIPKPK